MPIPRASLDPYVDFLLVGDSLGMVMHGYETTVPVPLDLMIMHGAGGDARLEAGAGRRRHAVRLLRGEPVASPSATPRACMKETGCGAIKLEGGARMAETIALSQPSAAFR